jgi:hypothetical protein
MCLSKIKRTFAGKGRTEYECYKVFDQYYSSKDLCFEFHTVLDSKIVPTNAWLTAEGDNIYSGSRHYPAGFHCFTTRKDAKQWGANQKIVKIRATGLVASGEQFNYCDNKLPVLVFKKIFVPRQK